MKVIVKMVADLDLDDHKENFDNALGEYADKEERIGLAKSFLTDSLLEIIIEAINDDSFEDLLEFEVQE